MSETAKVFELYEGIRIPPEHQDIEDLMDRLIEYGNREGLGIAAVIQLPNGHFRELLPRADRAIWALGALEILKKDIMRHG